MTLEQIRLPLLQWQGLRASKTAIQYQYLTTRKTPNPILTMSEILKSTLKAPTNFIPNLVKPQAHAYCNYRLDVDENRFITVGIKKTQKELKKNLRRRRLVLKEGGERVDIMNGGVAFYVISNGSICLFFDFALIDASS